MDTPYEVKGVWRFQGCRNVTIVDKNGKSRTGHVIYIADELEGYVDEDEVMLENSEGIFGYPVSQIADIFIKEE